MTRNFLAVAPMALFLVACGMHFTSVPPVEQNAAPQSLQYSEPSTTYRVGTLVENSALHSGGPFTSYSVSPPLPPGLFVDSGSGSILGAPIFPLSTETYSVTASGPGGEITAQIEITIVDIPPSPFTLSAKAKKEGVVLEWSESERATNYLVRRGISSGIYPDTLTTTTAKSFLDETAVQGTHYFYRITAINSGGSRDGVNEVEADPIWSLSFGTKDAHLYGMKLVVDAEGNFYVGGNTEAGLEGNTMIGTADTFVIKYNSAGKKVWARHLGEPSHATEFSAIAVDRQGNALVTGTVTGNLDGIQGPILGDKLSPTHATFVAKYNPLGIKVWTRLLMIGSALTQGKGIAADSSNNIYVTGPEYSYPHIPGEVPSPRNQEFGGFLAKYDETGTLVWSQRLLKTSAQDQRLQTTDVTVDPSGAIYVSGDVHGDDFSLFRTTPAQVKLTGDLDGKPLLGYRDSFIWKFDDSGKKLSTSHLGFIGIPTVSSEKILCDSQGNIYLNGQVNTEVGGEFNGTIGSTYSYIAKFPKGEDLAWIRTLGAEDHYDVNGAFGIDRQGFAYLFNWVISTDFFIFKFDGDGVEQTNPENGGPWIFRENANTEDLHPGIVGGIVFDASNNLYWLSSVNFDFGSIEKYDPKGVKQ